MNAISLRIEYRHGRPLAAYLRLPHPPGTKAARTEMASEDLVVDFAADGSPLGIEIVSPAVVSLAEIRAVFEKLSLTPPADEELAPLRAA